MHVAGAKARAPGIQRAGIDAEMGGAEVLEVAAGPDRAPMRCRRSVTAIPPLLGGR